MAGPMLVIVPILPVFVALQRYIVAGLTQGSVTWMIPPEALIRRTTSSKHLPPHQPPSQNS